MNTYNKKLLYSKKKITRKMHIINHILQTSLLQFLFSMLFNRCSFIFFILLTFCKSYSPWFRIKVPWATGNCHKRCSALRYSLTARLFWVGFGSLEEQKGIRQTLPGSKWQILRAVDLSPEPDIRMADIRRYPVQPVSRRQMWLIISCDRQKRFREV